MKNLTGALREWELSFGSKKFTADFRAATVRRMAPEYARGFGKKLPAAQDSAREREKARERKAAIWILVLTMAISAIVGLALTAYFQHP